MKCVYYGQSRIRLPAEIYREGTGRDSMCFFINRGRVLFRALAVPVLLMAAVTVLADESKSAAVSSSSAAAKSTTNSAATNSGSSSSSTFVPPKNEDEKRLSMLKDFISNSDRELLQKLLEKYKVQVPAGEKDMRDALQKYLGFLADLKDNRTPSKLVVQDLFDNPDLKKNFVVYADQGVHVRSSKDSENGLVTLRGDQGNLYVKFQSQLISARLIRLDIKRRQIFASGNAMLKEGDRILIGDKFYFSTETKQGVIYNAQTYIKPYFYYGKKIKKIGERNYVLEDGWFTTCNAKVPHFSFGVKKAWLYQDLRLVAWNVSYRVAELPIFWIPFIFHPMKGTGFWTGIGKDTRVGWYMQVGNVGQMLGLPLDMTFDYYQRLGIALQAAKKTFKVGGFSMPFELGAAIDKPLTLDGSGDWVNAVNGNGTVGDEKGTYGDWKRDFRWKIKIAPSFTLKHDPDSKTSGQTSFSGNFVLMSDALFDSDFNRSRQNTIDIQKLWRQDEVNFFSAGSPSSRVWDLRVTDKRGGSSLTLYNKITFSAQPNGDANRFANDYYEYRKQEVVLPSVSYSFSGKLLDYSSAKQPQSGTAGKTVSKTTNFLQLDEADSMQSVDKFSIGYTAKIDFSQIKMYDVEEKLYEQRYTRVLTLSVSPSLSLGSFFSTSMNIGLVDTDKWGDAGDNAAIYAGYTNASYAQLTESFSLAVGDLWNKGTLTEIGFKFKVNHSMALKLNQAAEATDAYNKISVNSVSGGLQLNFFKTVINAGTGYDLAERKDDIRTRKERFSNFTLSGAFTPSTYFTLNNNYTYAIRSGEPLNNVMTLQLKSPGFRLPFIQKISGLAMSIGWTHNYADSRNSRITFGLSFNMEINEKWSVNLSMASVNKELYRYDEVDSLRYSQKPAKNIFTDLLHSLMFWDSQKLLDTSFNLDRFSFSVKHDLHMWQMVINTTMQQLQNTTGRKFSYFDFQVNFAISMKQDLMRFPDHRFRYTADSTGQYYGKYN